MRESDRQFLEIISCAIRGEKFKLDKYKSIDWKSILSQAIEHNVVGLVYYGLDKSVKGAIDKEVFNKLKKYTFLSAVHQMKSNIEIKKIIIEFNKNYLTPIVLKGPCLRELYPLPELRTMSDLDLLINTHEFKEAQRIIEQNGYKKIKGEGGHLEYTKKGEIDVEFHLAHHFKGKREDERVFWNDCVGFNILNTEVKALSLEDNLVYLCIHMAKHMSISSVGVRQLCDFTLFIEKNHSIINWDRFFEKINIYGLKEFFLIMIKLCNEALKLNVPKNIHDMLNTVKDSYGKLIIHILDGGVFGKKHIRVLESIADKYDNYKKYKGLLIIAWFREIITLLREKGEVISVLKAPFIVFIYSIRRKRICRKIYL